MQRLLLVLAGVLLVAGGAAAQDLVYDDGGTHLLDSLDPPQPIPDQYFIEVRDGSGGAPTTLDVNLELSSPALVFDTYGQSGLSLLSIGDFAQIYTHDDSTALIEAGSFGCCEPSSFTAWDRSTVIVREGVSQGVARGESTVYFEPGVGFDPSVGNYYSGEDNSTTIMLAGAQSSTFLKGSAMMTVLGGAIGLDSLLVDDDAILVVDGGSIPTSYGMSVTGNGRVDIHSSAEDPYGSYGVGEFGLLRLFGSDFTLDGAPIGPGSFSGVAGLLSGTLESGQSLNVAVSVAATAALQIVPEPASGLLLAAGLALGLRVSRRSPLRAS